MHSRLTAHRLLPALVAGGLVWWLSCAHSVAQQAAPPVPAVEPPATVPVVELTAEEKSLAAIRSLLTSLGSTETELTQLRRSLSKALTQAERDQIAAEIEAKGTQRDQLRHDIESVATGIDLDQFSGTGSTPNDLATEFEDFIRPIIGELKSLTSKPREIEALRGNVAKYQRQIEQAKSAIDHLNDLLAAATEPVVTTQLRDLHKEWTDKLTTAENDLGVAEFKLEEAEKNRSSVFASAREAVAGFFRTRGRNFLTAGLAFVAVWFSLRLLYRKLLTYSPFHRRRERSFYVRLVDVAYQVFALAAGIFAVLVVLYSASDWVLLGLTLLFLAGLAWASKQALPLFFEQAKMMLNLGSVREGERLVFNGVPWEVKRINVYTDLDNPALTGGKLRLPIRDLVPLHSRPFEPKEPWFPTSEGDWVILADGTYGRVIQQTPEWVQLVRLGGARKTYATSDFLSQTPQNLSSNFRVRVIFGIDYRHQAIATTEPPAIFRDHLTRELGELVDSDEIINIGVEFQEAAASSLDYAILADFAGSAASKYQKLGRAIARICVDVCNEQGWGIPFTQITVHQAPAVEN